MTHVFPDGPSKAPRFLAILVVLTSFALTAQGQVYEIDLAKGLSKTETVAAGDSFKVKLTHLLPFNKDYIISVRRRAIAVPPLTIPKPDTAKDDKVKSFCQGLKTARAAVLAVAEEEALPTPLAALKKQVEATSGDCADELGLARAVLDATMHELGPYSLQQGEILDIIITRPQASGNPKMWKQSYSTQPRGEWQVSYGFSFITQGFSKEDVFFAEPQGSLYVIRKQANRRKLDFAPSIFFTWVPQKRVNRDLSWSVSGGLGFDFESPTVFLGPTVSYNQNIKFNVGVVAHKQRVLLGKYEANQQVSELLTEDQLHDKLYRLNPFFSLSLRLDKSPFAGGAGK